MYRSSTGALLLAAALFLTAGATQAAEDAKYPNWKGQWIVINPRYGGQAVKFDPTKAFGPAQQAPLTPEYQKIHEASMADQAKGGLGNYPTARCLPSGMPRIMSSEARRNTSLRRRPPIFWSAPTSAASSPTAATSPGKLRTELLPAIRWAAGSTRTATAVTTYWRSKRAAPSRAPAPMMRPACRCISTTNRSSRSGSTSQERSEPAARRDYRHRPRPDAAMERQQNVSA